MDAIYAAGVLGMLALLVWAATRQNEVFRVAIRRRRITVVRGRVPPSFLGDLREIAREMPEALEATVHAVKRDGAPCLVLSASIDERTAQRLRNAFGAWRASRASASTRL